MFIVLVSQGKSRKSSEKCWYLDEESARPSHIRSPDHRLVPFLESVRIVRALPVEVCCPQSFGPWETLCFFDLKMVFFKNT